jgi:hypothetical protein
MADRAVGVTDTAPATGVAEVLTQERPSSSITTTTTADPGTSGTSLAVTLRDKFPQAGSFKIRVENEIMLVTAGHGTGAGSFTVTRAQDGTAGVAHSIGVTVAQVMAAQYVIPISQRSISFAGTAAAFRTLGNAASPQNLFSIENGAGSGVIVGVSKLSIEMASTVANLAVPCEFKTSRSTALPTGGTTLTKVAVDTSLTSVSSVVLRGATASDGGAATAITATAGAMMWHQYANLGWTLVGQYLPDDYNMLPEDVANVDWFTLRAGEAFLVQCVNVTAGNNLATNHYSVKVAWFEYSIP